MGRLRLAERRGSLVAPNSQVQDLALQILMLADERATKEQMVNAIRHSLVAGGDLGIAKLHFPDYFAPEEAPPADSDEEAKDAYMERPDIVWGTPTSVTEDEDISEWINSHGGGSITLDAIPDDQGWM